MDSQKLAALLQESLIPDTTRIKAITAELQKTYTHAESLLTLIEIICTHSDVTVRQQAAVQAARLVPRHWKAPTAEQKTAVRQHLLEATLKEQNAKCRHSDAHLVAAIATFDFDDGEWPDLLPTLFNLATSADPHQREIGSYIIYSTLEANPVCYKDHVPKLIELFGQLIKDPASAEVQINTVMSIGALLVLVEGEDEEDEAAIAAVRELVPQMGIVLKNAVDGGDDEKVQQVFDVLQQFLVFSHAFIGTHLKSLVQFMIDLAVNTAASEDTRVQAMSFLTQVVHYRRLKIQAMKDMPAQLVSKSLQILVEIGEEDSVDEETPGHLALSLLDALASNLPPRQVIVPLLDEFPKYASSPNPALRKAGILALGNCAEGAPDFINTQIKSILPIVIQLLNDADGVVRHAALVGLTGLAEQMPESIVHEHAAIMAALTNNLQAAMVASADEEVTRKNSQVIRAVCAAFDSISDGLKADAMKQYALQMIEPIGQLFGHPDLHVKIAGAGALGAIAESLEKDFAPYFDKSMQALGAYATIKGEELELQLRSAVLDSIARIAVAVGAQMFQPYVTDLMHASEEGLSLDDDRLKESSFIFWSALSKVYKAEFKPFLPGVLKALMASIEDEDDDVVLNLTDEEKAMLAAGGITGNVTVGGKKTRIQDLDAAPGGSDDDDDDELLADLMAEDDDDDDDWAGMDSEAQEKEIAIESLGDVIANACGEAEMQEYLDKAIEASLNLTEHHYGGVRKAAVSLLWRAYARVWQLTEESTGAKWEPGFPPKAAPTPLLAKMAEKIVRPTLDLWTDENERDVVTDINRSISATLDATGPTVIAQEGVIQEIVSVLGQIITRSHPSQSDGIDEDGGAQAAEDSSEYDWLVVGTAIDVLVSLAGAIGPAFGELWKIFEKPIIKMASSNEAYERSAATGAIAGCAGGMGATVSPYTTNLLKLILHRLSDEDPETKSNAAFAIGELIVASTDSKTYLQAFPTILEKLERMLAVEDGSFRLYDNAAGAIARLITKHPDQVPIGDVLPSLVARLPLKEDYSENKNVYTCLYHLYQHNEPTVQALTPKLVPVFQAVLGEPEDQLDKDTRALVLEITSKL